MFTLSRAYPMNEIIPINSIAKMHQVFGLPKPKHPLISVVRYKNTRILPEYHDVRCSFGLYCITLKNEIVGTMGYGRSSYDFQEGSMLFIKTGQVLSYDGHHSEADDPGWALFFHPDLIRKSELGNTIDRYSFFSYELNEALHLSEAEKQSLNEILEKIENEYSQNIDRHSQKLIISNIELLLDYCTRYYDRQFYTRSNLNQDVLVKFERLLKEYYDQRNQLEAGIPTVAYCGNALNMSPKYLSDLLKRETGKNGKTHIDDFLLNRAKNQLLSTTESIGEIAFNLGFEYSQHFSKLFKNKTGMSPKEYRLSS